MVITVQLNSVVYMPDIISLYPPGHFIFGTFLILQMRGIDAWKVEAVFQDHTAN